jgi:hypothetical protein
LEIWFVLFPPAYKNHSCLSLPPSSRISENLSFLKRKKNNPSLALSTACHGERKNVISLRINLPFLTSVVLYYLTKNYRITPKIWRCTQILTNPLNYTFLAANATKSYTQNAIYFFNLSVLYHLFLLWKSIDEHTLPSPKKCWFFLQIKNNKIVR